MAVKKCLICNIAFSGRRDAKTCSARCRKRLQLLRLSFAAAPIQRQLIKIVPALALGLVSLLSLILGVWSSPAQAATSNFFNFQMRLLTSSGAVVADGNYHIEFKLYSAANSTGSSQGSCAGDSNCLWTETRTTGNLVRVVNGYMSVHLGQVTSFPGTINWDQELWLGVRIGGSSGAASWETIELTSDGTSTGNKIRLTAVPYAFRAKELRTTSGANSSLLQFATPTGTRTITIPDETGTVCTTGSVCSGYQTSGSYFVQGGNSFTAPATLGTNDSFGLNLEVNNITVASLSNTGAALFKNQTDSTTAFQIQNATGTNLLNFDTTKSVLSQKSFGATYLGGADASGSTNSGTGSSDFNFVTVSGRYEYIAKAASGGTCSQTAGSAIGCELQVYDVSVPGIPTYIGGADASGSTNSGTSSSAFNSISVIGHYAFVVKAGNASACSQSAGSANGCEFQVYDISNPAAPTYVGGADASGSTNSGTTNSTFRSIFASGRYAFITKAGDATACSQTAGSAVGCELQVYDLTNPASPTYIGGADTSGSANSGTGTGDFQSSFISGRYAYVAKGGDATACSQSVGSAVGCEVQVYDVSNPGSPTYIGGADASGSTNSGTGSLDFNSISVSGRYAYTVKNSSGGGCSQTPGSALGCELQVYDISNPAAPTYVGGADASGSTNSGTDASTFYSVSVSGSSVYVSKTGNATACSQSAGSAIGCELQVYDVSAPGSPTYVGGTDASGSSNAGTANSTFYSVFVSGRYIHIAKVGDATACSQTAGSAIGCEVQVYDPSGIEAVSILAHSLEAGSLQVQGSASINNHLSISGSVAIGQNVSIQGNIGVGGSALFKNTTNSSAAFQIQNAGGANLLNVNTLTSGLNLTSNPSMEQNIDGWVLRSVAGSPTIKVSEAFANFGSRSLEIVTSTGNGNGAEYRFPFAPSTQYSLSLYARRSTASAASFNIGRADNGTDTDCLTNQTLDTNWTQFSCTFTTGATIGTTSNFYIKQTDTTTDTIYIDGVTLVAGATALGFMPPAQNIQLDSNYSNLTFNNLNSGEIQPWQLSQNPLLASLREGGTTIANGYIYYMGGRTTAGGLVSTVYYAKLNADGSVGSWQTNTNALPVAIYAFGTVVSNGYIYAVGGWDGTIARTSVYYAKLNADGSTGAWQLGPNGLPDGRTDTNAVVANGFVYTVGGNNTAGTAQNTVYYAKLNADGSTGTWQTNANNLPGSRSRLNPVVANGYIYAIGGAGTEVDVYYAKLNGDGSTGTFSSSTSLPANRGYYGSVVANGYVYIIGGQNANSTAESTVYYAKLNADGTIGSWVASGNPLPEVRTRTASALVNGYIYILGGANTPTGNGIGTVYYTSTARVQLGGSLDLVGLGGQALGDVGATGGSLTAGNTSIIGSLDVRERANFTNGVGIGGSLNVGGTVNFQNSSGYGIFTTDGSGVLRSVFSGNLSSSSAAVLQSTSTVNTTVDSGGNVGTTTSIAIGTDGLPIISYYDTTNQDLKVMKCGNTSCSSGNTITTADSSLTSVGDGSAIAIGADGLPIIAYYTTTGGNLRVSKCANVACTSFTTTTDVDTTNNVGRLPSIAIGADGFAVISHWDSTNDNLRVTKCNNTNCTSVTNTDVDGGSTNVGNPHSIAVGHDGNPIVSYYEGPTTSCDNSPTTECSLHVAKFVGSGGTGCTSSAWTCTIVENPTSTGDVGFWNNIAIGRDGIPVVVFYDTGNTDPKLLRCGNTHCTTTASSTVIDTGVATIGQEISVAIGKDGLPVVAYKDSTNGDLRTTKCGNLACSSGNTNTTVDNSANIVGEWTDTAVLPDGLPVISHYDTTGDDLKISRCGSTTCAASGSTYTGGIDLGSAATPFQNVYTYNLNIQDVAGFQLLNTDAASKKITVKADIIAGNSATTTTATTSGTGTNVTTVALTAVNSLANGDVILIDNAGQDYFTRITAGGGTTSLTVTPAVTYEDARTVTKYNIQNIGAASSDYATQSDRFFQGYFLGGVVTGTGSTTLSDGMLTSTNELRIVAPNINLQRSSDSASAFQVQNAAGLQIFNIDSNSDATNLVTNPSFETNTTGWAAHNASTISRITSQQYIGSASLQIDADATNEGAKYSLTLTNSQAYSLSLYAKRDATTFTAFQMGHSNDNSTDTSCLTGQTVLNGGWTRFTCTFTYTGTTGTSYFYVKQTNGTTRSFYIDAVKLETGSVATAYRESGLLLNGVITSQLTHRNTNDSTAALLVQNAAGTNMMSIDTLNSKVVMGNFTSDIANNRVIIGPFSGPASSFNVEGTTWLSYNGSSPALTINRSSGSGNQILLQDNGTDIFSIGDSGNTLFKNSANSTTAFQVQQAGAGSTLFTVDTQNTKLIVNNSHIAITQTTAPTIGTPTNCGTTPSAAVTTGSADTAGSFRITAGTGGGYTTCDTVITFNITYGTAPKAIILTPTTAIASATGFKSAQVSAVTTTTFTVKLTTAPGGDSEVNSFYYWIVE